jgi:GrpB-like predicted nucleotidyltransferase (UPF0157 family)
MSESRRGPPIGLRRRTVVLRDPNPEWQAEFERASRHLAGILVGLHAGIEHIGSTAVTGLVAKPVIDVAIGFESRAALEKARLRLTASGYEDQGDLGDDGGVFIVKALGRERVHYLHLVELSSPQWRRWIAFREALRADESLRQRYAELKISLAKRFARDRASYTAGKAAFIQEALKELSV